MSNVNFSPIKLSDVAESWSITKEDYQKGGWEQMVGTYESVAGADGILNKQDLVAADANGDGCLTLEEIKTALQQAPTTSTTRATPNKAAGTAPVLDPKSITSKTTFSTKTVDGQLYVTIDGKDYKASEIKTIFGITTITLDANGDKTIGGEGDIEIYGMGEVGGYYCVDLIGANGKITGLPQIKRLAAASTLSPLEQATELMTTIMKDGSMKAFTEYISGLNSSSATDANKQLLKDVTQQMINIYYTKYNKTGETNATKNDQTTKDFLDAVIYYQVAMGITPNTTMANIENVLKDGKVTQAEMEALFAGKAQ